VRSPFAYLLFFVVAVALAVTAGVVTGPEVSAPEESGGSPRSPASAVSSVREPGHPEDARAGAPAAGKREPLSGERPEASLPAGPSGPPETAPTPGPAATLAGIAGPTGGPSPAGTPSTPGTPAGVRRAGTAWMRIPVQGVAPEDLVDTFPEKRGARPHEALDIHAQRGTPVVAAEGGVVQKLWESEAGGHTIYVLGAGGRFRYYYAHLEGYRAGLSEEERVEPGAVIGYVGDSGNAVPGDTHLHFAVFRVDDPEEWSGGIAVNALPYLLRKRPLPR
jgi:murein DD-endopeptidase MepM/ murein hydrolase activator NlpD